MNFRTCLTLAIAASFAAITGCATHVSRNISDDGVPEEVVFPDLKRIVLKQGTYPTVEALRQVGPGVTKDQLYRLLGRPHFREGFAGVKEWDYLFHFRQGDQVRTCQYKVIFDVDSLGQNFHWLPADCAAILDQPAPAAATQPTKAAITFSLSGDALFAFGRFGMADIQPGGRQQLQRIAEQLRAPREAQRIDVVGHTDRIGSRQDNQALSQKRAETVRMFLAEQGVAKDSISARGAGMDAPVVTCADDSDRVAVIRCLQPNRRVEIRASGTN